MKKILLLLLLMISLNAEEMCFVQICNKIERFSIDPFSHLKDKFAESCFDTSVPKSEAVEGKVLSSESRWYQGSFNPTKKSITKIKKVYSCRK